MATLEVIAYAGVASSNGMLVEMIDGGPTYIGTITTNGNLPGTVDAPKIVKLNPIGGDVALTWTATGITETINSAEYRRVRGEAVSVA